MYITKTDYLEYTYCKKNLWFKKHKPELFEDVELSEFEKKIIEEGNAADAAAQNLFSGGILINAVEMQAVQDTKAAIDEGKTTLFQAAFSSDVFYIRADVLQYNESLEGWELFEVKASNDIKRKEPNHYVNDLAFQKTVIEQSGLNIVKASVIHLNRNYRRQGQIDYQELFVIEDINDEVVDAQEHVQQQMQDMKIYLSDEKEEKGCECLYRGRNAQCTTFVYSNPNTPEYSVHDINRIGSSKKVLEDWIDRGVYAIDDIDNPEQLRGAKKAQYNAYISGKPVIKKDKIKEELSKLKFPLQFFDYEGFVSAIPKFDGFGAYEQVPFQYSLHVLEKDGTLTHKEFLITEPQSDITGWLAKQLTADIDPAGTVIAWYVPYEQGRNKKLASLHPEHADFFESVNANMFDLMHIFSKNMYVDAAFKGSSSIKKVLPVLVSDLTYENMNIAKGDQASERWERMIADSTPKEEKEQIAQDLLAYCKLDTLAMVRIYEKLNDIT